MLKYQNENETQIWPSSEINNCLPNGKIQTVLETNTLLWLWVCFANIGNNYLRCLFQSAVQNNKHMATVHPAKEKKKQDKIQKAGEAQSYSNKRLEHGHPLPFEGIWWLRMGHWVSAFSLEGINSIPRIPLMGEFTENTQASLFYMDCLW